MFNMNNYQLLCLAYVTFGSVLYGYDTAITTSVLAYDSFLTYFKLNSNTIGAFNSTYYATCTIGNVILWYLPDKIGRIRTIQVACVINVAAIVLQAAAQNYAMFLVGRAIGGLCSGMICTICPIYASEISPPHIRGRVSMVYAMNVSAAYAITEWLSGLGLFYINGNANWRVLFALQAIPTAIVGIGSLWMPSSPRWLVMKDRLNEARAVIKRLHGGQVEGDVFVESEFLQIQSQINLDRQESLGLMDILKRPSYRKRLLLIAGFFLFQQLTGTAALQAYQVIIYKICGFSASFSLVLVGIWGTVVCIAVGVMSPWIDRVGRRVIMFVAYGFMIPGSLLVVILWARFDAGGDTDLGLAKGIIFGMFVVIFGFGGVTNTFAACYAAEILPTSIRAVGVSAGFGIYMAFAVMLIQVTPLAIEHISWKFFLIFLICDCIYIVIFYLFYPETKDKTLEEIEAIFGDEVAVTLEEATKQVSKANEEAKSRSDHVEDP
ncbi:hypothetical protein LTS17_005394 [Exophiala oligosperma]